jgi:acetyltransferase-like isoleucine patch superfamily enzyme
MAQSPNGIPSTNNQINSITRQAKVEPFDLQVSRGQIFGHQTLSLFGYQSAIGNTKIPVWENATTYTYITTASTLTLVSSSASDDTLASILINGLDANFKPISEIIGLNGVTGVTTVNSYFRVNSMIMVSPGTSQSTNVGIITLKQVSNIVAQINAGISKTQSTIYTVPAGYSFYLDFAEVNTSNSYTSSNIVTYSVQAINNPNNVKLNVLQQPFVSIYTANRSSDPFLYAEKTDVQWQLVTSTATTIAAGVIIAGKLISNGS